MAGVYHNPDIGRTLAGIMTRLRAMETQQQNTIVNIVGQAVATLGLLVNSAGGTSYGIAVTDPPGASTQLLPVYAAYAAGPLSVTSIPAVIPGGTPTVTGYTGLSGDALVSVSTLMAGTVAPKTFLVVDGVIQATPVLTASNLTATCAGRFQLSQFTGSVLSANAAHTFTLAFASGSASVAATFSTVSLIVEPI